MSFMATKGQEERSGHRVRRKGGRRVGGRKKERRLKGGIEEERDRRSQPGGSLL
jgi:hypothetical protein